MKHFDHSIITITVAHNGYYVKVPGEGAYGGGENNWTFESMEELQRRLPEILAQPVEKRPAVIKGGPR